MKNTASSHGCFIAWQAGVSRKPTKHSLDARERLLRIGASALSNSELIALILGTGSAQKNVAALATELLNEFPSLRHIRGLDPKQLSKKPGIGSAKASRLLAAFELGSRANHANPDSDPVLNSSAAVDQHLRPRLAHLQQEHLLALCLDTRLRLKRELPVAIGGLSSCSLRPADVFRPVLSEGASAVLLVHNHPSGDPKPSPEDEQFTHQVEKAGALLGISLVDHIIIGSEGYFSFNDQKMLLVAQDGQKRIFNTLANSGKKSTKK
ncbi:MAG: DNA repair protein RadC [Myxococcales bacterium]|nr:MAG: DNA repair protein RadC [Myxococcales bacterium]